MDRYRWAWFALAAVAVLAALWGCRDVPSAAVGALDAWASAGRAVQDTAHGTDALLAAVAKPCDAPPPGTPATVDGMKNCGTLANVDRALQTVRGAMGQLEGAAKKNSAASKDLHETQAALRTALTSLAGASDAASGLLDAAKDDAAALRPALDAAPALLRSATVLVGHADDGVQDARASTAPADLARLVKAGAGATEHVEAMTGDLRARLHPVLNPDPCKTKACVFKRRVVPVFTGVARFGESAYWTDRFIRAMRGEE